MKLLKIEKYSHGVRVSGYSEETYRLIKPFLTTLMLRELENIPRTNRKMMVTKKLYFGETKDRKQLFIHIYSLKDFLNHLADNGIYSEQIKTVELPLPAVQPATFKLFDKYVLRDYQQIIQDDILRPVKSARIDLQTGKGKDQPLTAKIKVPGGWSTMGAMTVGSIITAPDGSPTKVTAVYPQGVKDVYRITFADGRSTEAGAGHLWKVFYINTSVHKRWRIVDTLEMLRLISVPQPRVYVQLIDAEDGDVVKLPMAPYTLGVILGDGGISNGAVMVTKADSHVFERMTEEFPEDVKWRDVDHITKKIVSVNKEPNLYRSILQDMGLMGTRSWEKFIPTEYLTTTSRKQRLELLQGLLDTDGTVGSHNGTVSFSSTSWDLALGVQYLIRSIGGIASISTKTPSYPYKGELKKGRLAYQVNIRHVKPSELFSLPRKKERTNDDNQYSKDLKLRVMSVEFIGEKETQCITVDHPDHLYVTDDFIVTHNTLISLATVTKLQCKTIAMLPPKYFGLWDTALEDTYYDIKDRILTVAGSDNLKKVINRALADDLKDIDFFMVSNTTYRAYIDAFELHGDNLASVGYNVPPTRFHEVLGVGCQINDEIQEDPGLLFRIDLYTNVPKQIYLSATPFTGNKYVTKMIDLMLPEETKVRLPDLSVYINCMGLVYSDIGIKPKDYLTPFKNTYNHARYETQMMLNNKRHTRYKALIKKAVMALFVRDRLPQQKMLLLCATVAFINDMVEFLRSEFPELEINEHVSGSPYERLLTNDITVSTIKSSGTGVDIPNLRETFLLQASGSEKDKIQILGRTRPLKLYPDVDPRMTYLICEQIPQHLKYSTETQRIFKPRTLDMSIKRISI